MDNLTNKEWEIVQEAIRHAMRVMEAVAVTPWWQWENKEAEDVYMTLNNFSISITRRREGGEQA